MKIKMKKNTETESKHSFPGVIYRSGKQETENVLFLAELLQSGLSFLGSQKKPKRVSWKDKVLLFLNKSARCAQVYIPQIL